jgi:hypothetical protein
MSELTENMELTETLTPEQQEQLLLKYKLQKQKRHERYVKLKELKDQQNPHKNSPEILNKILNSKTVLKLLKTIKKPNKNDELKTLEAKYIELKEKYENLYKQQNSNDDDVDVIVDDVVVDDVIVG